MSDRSRTGTTTLFKHGIILFLLLALFGCSPARPKPLAQPDVIVPQGDFVHAPSGMRFPQQVGEFERRAVQRKDTQGLDMSARYDLLSMSVTIAAAVDVYPLQHLDTAGLPPEMAAVARENLSQQTFDARKREFMGSRPGSVLVQEGDVSLPQNDNPFPGKMAVFEYTDVFQKERQTLRAHLYLFCFAGGGWAVQYQFTFPGNADALYAVEAFLSNLAWTLKPLNAPGAAAK